MAQYYADDFAGMTAGEDLSGRTASDGTSTYQAGTNIVLADGVGGVYAGTSGGPNAFYLTNASCPTANQVITFSFVPGSAGSLTTGTAIGVVCKQADPTYTGHLRAYIWAWSGDYHIALEEYEAYGQVSNKVQADISAVTATVHCTLTVSAGTATLVMTGGLNQTLTLPLSMTAALTGKVGIYAWGPGTPTPTTGWHLGPVVASSTTTPATTYAIRPARLYGLGISWVNGAIVPAYNGSADPPQASLLPAAWYIANDQVGFNSTGYLTNGTHSICLDGVAPAGGITLTPTAGSLETSSGTTPVGSIAIPAGSDAAIYSWRPPAGLTSNTSLSFTNSGSLADGSPLAITIAPRLALFEGDSISDVGAGTSIWPPQAQATMGTGWLCRSISQAYSQLGGNPSNAGPLYDVSLRGPITWGTCHDPARTQEALIIWAGTNDIEAGADAATVQSRLQAVVNAAKGYGWRNIAVITCISRNWTNPGTAEPVRTAYNTWMRSAYGSSGSDPSVALIDVAADAAYASSTAYQDSTYYGGDGIHPTGSASGPKIAGYVTAYLQALPATQGPTPGVLAYYHSRRRRVA